MNIRRCPSRSSAGRSNAATRRPRAPGVPSTGMRAFRFVVEETAEGSPSAESDAEDPRPSKAGPRWVRRLPPLLQNGHRQNPLTTTHRGGQLLNALQLPWFLLAPPRGYGVIETVGRRTGRRRRRCVRVVRSGSRACLVAIAGSHSRWLKNVLAHPEITLRLPGGRVRGVAQVVPEVDREAVRHAFCGFRSWFDRPSYVVHYRGLPTRARCQDMWERFFDAGTPLVVALDEA